MSRLEYLRRARGLSQRDLAELINYSEAMISRLECHRPDPGTVGKRLRIAVENYFHEPLEKLLSPVEIETSRRTRDASASVQER